MEFSITIIILAVTALISLQAFQNHSFKQKMLLRPYLMYHHNEWYRFLSHGFIHADWLHLFFNMYVLYVFGVEVENAFEVIFGSTTGTILYAAMYLSAIPVAAAVSYLKYRDVPSYGSLGASGAVSAVVFSFILLAPLTSLYLIFIPIPIPGWIFGGLYLLYSWYMGKRGGDNINHEAHFFGALYGVSFLLAFKSGLALNFVDQIKNSF